ncbi:MAG: protein-L-isoaspartate O-methyltransferase family protein, partial [Rhodoferax sp.]
YMTALLAHFAQRVVALEIVPELATLARNNLRNAGVQNAEVRQADGASASPAEGTYDAILLTGSVAQIPANLLNLLKIGGRLAAIVGDEPVMRATTVTRTGEASFHTVTGWDTLAPRLVNFPELPRFTL